MPNGKINTKGRLERGKPSTTRDMSHYNETIDRLHEAFHFKKKLRKSKEKEKVTFVNKENIIRSIHDKLPVAKFAGDTVAIFKGKTFLFMANEYPDVFITFFKERQELIISKEVLDHLISVAKQKIKNRSNA